MAAERMVMHPTWGAIEELLDPQRRQSESKLLRGERGIDPGSTPIGGLPNEEVPWKLRPVGSAIPEPVTAPPAAGRTEGPRDREEMISNLLGAAREKPGQHVQGDVPEPEAPPDRPKMMADILGAARAGGRPAKAKIPTVYDTPYGAQLRAADEEARKANNDWDQRATRYNQERLARLGDSYNSRKIAMKERGATTEPMSIYDTPYGEQIRTSEEKLKKARGYQVKPALEDREHFTRLAERHIAQTEGLEEHWDSAGAKERASENDLINRVLEGSDNDQAGIRKERMARILARERRYTRGAPLDRGEAGVWQQVTDNETGESWWEETPVPAKRPSPSVRGIGAGGRGNARPQRRARTATDPKTGRKAMWNGSAWVPLR